MAEIVQLINEESNEELYPITSPKAIIDDKGQNLDGIIQEHLDKYKILTVKYDDIIQLIDYSQYSIIMISYNDGDIMAKIFPCSTGGCNWIYEWEEGYRVVYVYPNDYISESWHEYLTTCDNNSSPIATLKDIDAGFDKDIIYNHELNISNRGSLKVGDTVFSWRTVAAFPKEIESQEYLGTSFLKKYLSEASMIYCKGVGRIFPITGTTKCIYEHGDGFKIGDYTGLNLEGDDEKEVYDVNDFFAYLDSHSKTYLTESSLENYYTKTQIDNTIGNIKTLIDNI